MRALHDHHQRLRRADRVNPFDPRLSHLLDAWAAEAVAAAATAWDRDADVSSFLTADVFLPVLRATIDEYAVVVNDVNFDVDDSNGTLTIEHAASGLRARASFRDDGFGEINSDPERVRSTTHDSRDGQRYTRLGIGTRIYTWFGHLHPDVRWRYGGPVSISGAGVRRVMHAQAPLRWEGPCDWCEEQRIDWETATPDTYAGHPLADGENPDGWVLLPSGRTRED